MNKQWIPKAAGILNIISGVVQFTIFATVAAVTFLELTRGGGWDVGKAMWLLYAAIALPLGITGILAILGGVYVMQKRRWKLAYLGAFTACFPFILIFSLLWFEIIPSMMGGEAWWLIILTGSLIMLVGIAALVLTLLAEKEPEKQELSGRIIIRKGAPIAAGILNMTSGAFQLSVSLYSSYEYIASRSFSGAPWGMIFTVPFAVTGIVAIVGGIYTLQMKKWRLVYFGALAAFIPLLFVPLVLIITYVAFIYHPSVLAFLLVGISALILSLQAEKKFKQQQTLLKAAS